MTHQEQTLPPEVWSAVREALSRVGINLDQTCGSGCLAELSCETEGEVENGSRPRIRMVCVAPHLSQSVEQVTQATRENVVMVRVDESTLAMLDAWVQTGAVKSRSEAAAVFIKEGLTIRQTELDQLREAIDEVEQAKAKLSARVTEVFGTKAAGKS